MNEMYTMVEHRLKESKESIVFHAASLKLWAYYTPGSDTCFISNNVIGANAFVELDNFYLMGDVMEALIDELLSDG